jgi:hypothetical protein
MLELLVILAMFGWVILTVIQFLSSLEAFPTIAAAVVAIPLLAIRLHARLLRSLRLEFLRGHRGFLPPERFYWRAQAAGLRRELAWCVAGVLLAWPLAIVCPAALALSARSAAGWLAGGVAIGASALFCSRLAVYLRASQRYDRFTPIPVGWLRRFMFWISDNYDFLGEEPEVRRRKKKEAIY